MVRYSFLTFVILLETLQAVYSLSGNDSFDQKHMQKTELESSHFVENNEHPSEKKMIEKRGLLFNEGEVNPPPATGREFENNEYSPRRRTNFTITETDTETQFQEYQKPFKNWENKPNMFPFPPESRSIPAPEFRLMQPMAGQPPSNQNLNWGQRTDIFGTGKQPWNEERNIKQISNPDYDKGFGNNYSGRVAQVTSEDDVNANFHPGRNGEVSGRRMSLVKLNDEPMVNPRNNEERAGDMNSEQVRNPNGGHNYNRNAAGFWSPHFFRPEKGVIINFNTECPAPGGMPRQLANQMLHKIIYAPKPTVPEISPFQMPETSFIPSRRGPPMYYF